MGLPASRMRIIALSATLPNAEDFGSFLGAEVFRFGDEYRPVSLQVRFGCINISILPSDNVRNTRDRLTHYDIRR